MILKRYPKIIEDKGADLNNDKKISGDEVFGDLDKNGTVGNDKDFWLYLEKNKSLIAKQVDFVAWEGAEISSDNIINHLLFLESQLCKKEDIQNTYRILNEVVAQAKQKAGKIESPEWKLKGVLVMLHDDFNINFQVSDKGFTDDLLKGIMDCNTVSFLFLAIAHELKWPLYAVKAPQHVFLRWDDGSYRLNFDIGRIYTDKYYQEQLKIDDSVVKNGTYLKNLSQRETKGLFYYNRGNTKCEGKDYGGANEDYLKAIEFYPKLPEAYNNIGIIKSDLRDNNKAIEYFSKALALYPKFGAAYMNRGISKNKIGDYKGAIEDFSEVITLDPKYAPAYLDRCKVKAKMGDSTGASADFKEYKKLTAGQ